MNSVEQVGQTLTTIRTVSNAYRNTIQRFASDEDALSILRRLGNALDRVQFCLESGREDEEYCRRLEEIAISDDGSRLLISLYFDSMQVFTYLQHLAGVGGGEWVKDEAIRYTHTLTRYEEILETVRKRHSL
jgi:hypothetical protein